MKALVLPLVIALSTCAPPDSSSSEERDGQAFCCDSLESGRPYGWNCVMVPPTQIDGCAAEGRAVLQCGEVWAIRPPVVDEARRLSIPTTDAMCFVGGAE